MPDISTEIVISSTVLSTSASSITFSSIPNTYTDLRLVLSPIGPDAANMTARLNGDTASNYGVVTMYGNHGDTVASAGFSNRIFMIWTAGSSSSGMGSKVPFLYTADIFSYAGSTFKSFLLRNSEKNYTSGYIDAHVGTWRSTSAVTSITIEPYLYTFGAGTTATLYGIL